MPDGEPPELPLTARLVAAYLRANPLPAEDIPDLIATTHAALTGIAMQAAVPAERAQPAVPIKKSVTPEAIVCLECGKRQQMLKRHLTTAHASTVEEYRTKWDLPSDYPMTAPGYAQKRSQLALKFGLGRKETTLEPEASEESEITEKRGHRYPPSRWSRPAQ